MDLVHTSSSGSSNLYETVKLPVKWFGKLRQSSFESGLSLKPIAHSWFCDHGKKNTEVLEKRYFQTITPSDLSEESTLSKLVSLDLLREERQLERRKSTSERRGRIGEEGVQI